MLQTRPSTCVLLRTGVRPILSDKILPHRVHSAPPPPNNQKRQQWLALRVSKEVVFFQFWQPDVAADLMPAMKPTLHHCAPTCSTCCKACTPGLSTSGWQAAGFKPPWAPKQCFVTQPLADCWCPTNGSAWGSLTADQLPCGQSNSRAVEQQQEADRLSSHATSV